MSRGKRRLKGEKIGDQFAGLSFNLIKSRAYAELTGNAVKILMLLMTHYNGRNNGFIQFGLRDTKLNLQTGKRGLLDLWDKGFIKRTKAGVYKGNTSEWLLTFRKDDRNGHARTDDWKLYPNNERDAELIALLSGKNARKNNGRDKKQNATNDNEPTIVTSTPLCEAKKQN